nr:uncharacterized mitochondrial protein AtMg00810-like [Tanacetum cinerariifolium]
MLIFSRASLFLWAEAIATACFTQNHSIIHRRFNKTPYELINGRKPDISFLYVFGALYYPKNDREDIRKLGAKDIGKLGAKGDIGFFIGYSTDSYAYRIYNRRTKKIMKTMNVSFHELSAMAFEQRTTARTVSPAQEPQVRLSSTASTTIADTAPIPTNSSSHASNVPIPSQDVDELNLNAMVDANTFVNPFANASASAAAPSSQQNVDPSNMHTFYQPYPHEIQWTKDHPLEQVIGEPSRPVLTRNQLRSDGDMCMYALSSKYVLEILKKYGMESCDPVGTPMEIKDKLDLDQNGTSVDATKYRSMIGALMYLTSSRPNIVHATCLCARYQAKPTEKRLKEVKWIFRYLRGSVNMGLWYTKDSGFELTGFSDADYAGCKDTFKSTFGGAHFLGEKLVSWSSKKQDYTTLSTVEAEYVSLSACCAQVLWIRTQLTDYGFHFNKIPIYCDLKSAIAISCNPVQHSRTKHVVV